MEGQWRSTLQLWDMTNQTYLYFLMIWLVFNILQQTPVIGLQHVDAVWTVLVLSLTGLMLDHVHILDKNHIVLPESDHFPQLPGSVSSPATFCELYACDLN